jgi:hypothetical protein
VGLFNPGSGTGGVRAKAQRLEMLIGILGFFTFMAFVQAVVTEIRGEDAVFESILLAVFVAVLWFVIQRRRSMKL